ncbi:MAG: hypothetical protein OK422_00375 [Thaumarchaeota archaeon]|nr:hypothetical protein [Nitrososphaerota archaeon]
MLKRQMLQSIRTRSWFRLTQLERSLYRLAIRLKIRLESLELMRALVSVLKKLRQFGRMSYRDFLTGTKLAWTFSDAAVSWGNDKARPWRYDQNYIRFLGKLYSRAGPG